MVNKGDRRTKMEKVRHNLLDSPGWSHNEMSRRRAREEDVGEELEKIGRDIE